MEKVTLLPGLEKKIKLFSSQEYIHSLGYRVEFEGSDSTIVASCSGTFRGRDSDCWFGLTTVAVHGGAGSFVLTTLALLKYDAAAWLFNLIGVRFSTPSIVAQRYLPMITKMCFKRESAVKGELSNERDR